MKLHSDRFLGMTWAQLLRRWADAVRVALVVTACGLLIGGRPTEAIPLALISATAIALRPARPSAAVESIFVTLLAVDAWLTCSGLMAQIARQDAAGHFLLTIAVTPVLAAAIVRASPWTPRSIRWIAGLAGLATIAIAVGWEVVESCSDALLGTNMSLNAADTRHDLVSDLIGAAAGTVLTARAWSRDMTL
jgi:hypothetical protein